MVEAAGVEPEVDITTIRVYDDLPNVYRILWKEIFQKGHDFYCMQTGFAELKMIFDK